jgi:hypothetical protein
MKENFFVCAYFFNFFYFSHNLDLLRSIVLEESFLCLFFFGRSKKKMSGKNSKAKDKETKQSSSGKEDKETKQASASAVAATAPTTAPKATGAAVAPKNKDKEAEKHETSASAKKKSDDGDGTSAAVEQKKVVKPGLRTAAALMAKQKKKAERTKNGGAKGGAGANGKAKPKKPKTSLELIADNRKKFSRPWSSRHFDRVIGMFKLRGLQARMTRPVVPAMMEMVDKHMHMFSKGACHHCEKLCTRHTTWPVDWMETGRYIYPGLSYLTHHVKEYPQAIKKDADSKGKEYGIMEDLVTAPVKDIVDAYRKLRKNFS